MKPVFVRPSYRKSRGHEYAELIWVDPRTGKRARKSLGRVGHGPGRISRSQVKAEAAKLQAEFAQIPAMAYARSDMLVVGWCDRYMELRQTESKGRSTLATDRTTISLLKKHLGERRIDRVGAADADDWRGAIAEGRRPHTVKNHVMRARLVFQRAVDRDLIASNPFAAVRVSAPPVVRKSSGLTAANIAALVEHAQTPKAKRLVALCAYAGLRAGEAHRLLWRDVDFDRNRLRIHPPNASESTKHKYREPLLVPELAEILRSTRGGASEDQRVVGEGRPGNSRRLMFGAPATKSTRRYIGIAERAGVKEWDDPLHDLRRWRSDTWKAEMPEHVVDAMLGHSLAVARQHYNSVPESYYGVKSEVEVLRDEIERLRAENQAMRDAAPQPRRNRAKSPKSK